MNTGSEHPAERLISVHSKSTIKSMLNIGCSAAQLHDSQRLLFLFLFIIFLFQVLGLFWGNGLWMGNINSLIMGFFAFLATRKQLFKKKKSEIILKLKQAALFLSLYWFPRWFWNANRNFKHREIWVVSQTYWVNWFLCIVWIVRCTENKHPEKYQVRWQKKKSTLSTI